MVGGISQRMLTLTLRGLERDGLVKRTQFLTIPPRVDYELTQLGRSLWEAGKPLGERAQRHVKRVESAGAGLDKKTSTCPAVLSAKRMAGCAAIYPPYDCFQDSAGFG